MARALQVLGFVMVIIALVHTVQHTLSETGFEGNATGDIWEVLDYFMAVGLVVSLVIGFMRFMNSRGEDSTERLLASSLVILVVATSILFVEQWFTVELLAQDGFDLEADPLRLALWEAVDILYILVMGWIGVHLIRSKGSRVA